MTPIVTFCAKVRAIIQAAQTFKAKFQAIIQALLEISLRFFKRMFILFVNAPSFVINVLLNSTFDLI